jgi:hypothetical protein
MDDSDSGGDLSPDSSDAGFFDFPYIEPGTPDDVLDSESPLFDEDGYLDRWALDHFSDLLLIDHPCDGTGLTAAEYVLSAIEEASDVELERLRIAVVGAPAIAPMSYAAAVRYVGSSTSYRTDIGPQNPRRMESLPLRRHVGGAQPDDIDQTDEHVSRFWELCDAVHDFADNPGDKDMREHLLESIAPVLADDCGDNNERVRKLIAAVVPVGIKFHRMWDKNELIKAVTAMPHFVFKLSAGTITRPNHVRGRNLEAGIQTYEAGKSVSRVVGPARPDMQNVDLYFKRAPLKKRFATIEDLVELRKVMDSFYGARASSSMVTARPLPFMIDQDMRTDKNRPHCHLFAWMTGFEKVLVKVTKYFVHSTGSDLRMSQEEFKSAKYEVPTALFKYCDASLHDGGSMQGFTLSSNVTGKVFHKKSQVQFEFVGPNGPKEYGYKVHSRRPAYNPININQVGKPDIHRTVSAGWYTDVSTGHSDFETLCSAPNMKKFIDRLKAKGLHAAAPSALKRAGDWGQIEHCKKNNIIFVTADRLSALYAMYRDVPVLLVKHSDHIQKDDTATHVQYSFCMGGSMEARQRLWLGDTPTTPVQGGGGICMVSLVCLAVLGFALFTGC